MKNRDLFYKLLEPIHPMAENFCRKLAGSRDDGDDLYQEGLLKAMTRFDKLRDMGAFKPWLFRILVNCHKNRARTSWFSRAIPLSPDIAESGLNPDPTDHYAARHRLGIALKALGSEERAIVVLFELEGWSVKDLAEMLDSREGTIKSRLSRARVKMRERLAEMIEYTHDKHPTGDRICAAAKRKSE